MNVNDEERGLTALVLLELAVARGCLSFTLSVWLHLQVPQKSPDKSKKSHDKIKRALQKGLLTPESAL
jgi:hypothetical protein